jgi:TRAP-type uncharacterized transport system substrate-binding protein
MSLPRLIFCSVVSPFIAIHPCALAQPSIAEINQKTLTLLSGEAQWFDTASAINHAVGFRDGLRVLTVHGDGCIESAADLLQLGQVDAALLTADCVSYAQAQGLVPETAKKFTYIARIKAVPLLIVTSRANANLTSLAGKRIATGPANSAGFASGELLLGGLELPFIRVARSGADALSMLQKGETDAVLLQGTDALDGSLDASQFHVLGLAAPQSLSESYAPALIEAAALKGLAGSNALETVSTALVLAVFNWPTQSAKAQKIKNFTKVYFEQQAVSEDATELSASISGWTRNDISQKALDALTATTPNLQQGDGP